MNHSLRDKVLKLLECSTEKIPVPLKRLRDHTAKDVANIDELDNLLDRMVIANTVAVRNGYKEGIKVAHYWLTGKVQTPATPPEIAKVNPIAATVQPNTSIHIPQFIPEKIMALKNTANTGIGQVITDIVIASPGIDIDALFKKTKLKIPNTTMKHVYDMTYYLDRSQKIERRGVGKAALMYPYTGTRQEAVPPAAKPKKSKAAPAAKVAVPAQRKAPNGAELYCSFNLGGSLSIGKGDQNILLDAQEALKLMQFANHQLTFASTVA